MQITVQIGVISPHVFMLFTRYSFVLLHWVIAMQSYVRTHLSLIVETDAVLTICQRLFIHFIYSLNSILLTYVICSISANLNSIFSVEYLRDF